MDILISSFVCFVGFVVRLVRCSSGASFVWFVTRRVEKVLVAIAPKVFLIFFPGSADPGSVDPGRSKISPKTSDSTLASTLASTSASTLASTLASTWS